MSNVYQKILSQENKTLHYDCGSILCFNLKFAIQVPTELTQRTTRYLKNTYMHI